MEHKAHALAGYLLLLGTILFGWWGFSGELKFVDVQYSDVAFHLSVLKSLDVAVKGGQSPLDFWYDTVPYGFALFRSYQYLPYLIMYGAFRIFGEHFSLASILISSTVLLASTLLPLSIFYSLRTLGAPTLQCGIAAALSVLISDGSEFGMGLQNYTFGTYGLTTQLWAMVFLPQALAYSFQFLTSGNSRNRYALTLALLFSFLTFGSHVVAAVMLGICIAVFSLAILLGMLPLQQTGLGFLPALRRPALFLFLFALITAHQWWFILVDAPHINRSALEPVWKYEGRGLTYLVELFWNGDLLDRNRFPALTTVMFPAFLFSCIYWRSLAASPGGRFSVFAPIFCLLFFSLTAGRAIWGWLFDLIPVFESLHVHRFLIGFHLFAVILIASFLHAAIISCTRTKLQLTVGVALFLALISPAVRERNKMFWETNERQRSTAQLIANDTALRDLLDALDKAPYGWTYIGAPGSWQKELLVAGYMPLDLSTTMLGVPTVGGILYHGFSLAGETLFDFNPQIPAHFDLFGIRNIVAPQSWTGSPGFSAAGTFGRYTLWTRESHRLFVGDERFQAELPYVKRTDAVRSFVQQFRAMPNTSGAITNQQMEHPWKFSGTVQLQAPATIVAAQGFHPNWLAAVGGQPTRTRRVPPGLMAIDVPAGRHEVVFEYQGSPLKFFLLALSIVLTVASAWSGPRLRITA